MRFLLFLFFCLAFAQTVLARTWEPGVVEGDYFYYEIYGVCTSNDPDAIIYVPPFERNNPEWVKVEITGISGSRVYQNYTFHF